MNNASDDLEIARRHTASHVMTAAVKMIHPEVKLGVGPWTDDGFYQDFELPDGQLSEKDFKDIQKKMRWIVNKDFKIVRKEVNYATAKKEFEKDKFKQELINDLKAKGETVFSFYDFEDENGKVVYRDFCAGPHLNSTGEVGIFKLMKIAGSYWRGDSKNPMLDRIYGVAFENEEKLKEYEHFLEEAARRDHRKIGQELELFTFSEKVGSGLPLFTPKGAFMRNQIESVIMKIQQKYGFEKVSIPHITKKDLYETSGHWEKFKDDLFHVRGKGDTEFVMKPMNCPHHTQIYASGIRSYRDLPIRYAETTTCYRDEQPGELLGLSRVRSLTQDDGHIFCRLDQVKQEAQNLVKVVREFYSKLEMFNEGDFWVSLSVRDPEKPEKYLGKPENWVKAEAFLEEVANEEKLPWQRVEGEAAFYGPKLDFQFKDALGREWQLATIQIDFVMPERFKLEFTNKKGEKETPIMIHRAIAGSLERFMSVIIEHFAGHFPLWLAPVQVAILPISGAQKAYAEEVLASIKSAGGRPEMYEEDETLSKRIRKSQTRKIPYSVIIGDEEMQNKTVTIRKYGEQKDEKMSLEKFITVIQEAEV